MSDKSSSTIDDIHDLHQPIPRTVLMKGFQNTLGLWTMNIFLFLLAGLISGYFTYTNTVPFWSSFYGSPASGAVIGKF